MNALTPQNFWKLADRTKMAAEYRADRNLLYLRTAPLKSLQRIFIQYRFFTIYYISDLAHLISRMPFGSLRTCLAEFLAEELGNGDATQAHPRLYDDFLLSLGISEEALAVPNRKCLSILDGVRTSLWRKSWAYGVGLRGMGGECLCQIYLSSMHEHFMHNPVIQALKDRLAWKFWDIHIGEVDLHHVEMTRKAITELLRAQPEMMGDLASGYLESKFAWEAFWKKIFLDAKSPLSLEREEPHATPPSPVIARAAAF